MKLQEIKDAVRAGKTVHWKNDGYTVRDSQSGWLIVFHTGDCIGLTWRDGVTMNGKEDDFYIAAS